MVPSTDAFPTRTVTDQLVSQSVSQTPFVVYSLFTSNYHIRVISLTLALFDTLTRPHIQLYQIKLGKYPDKAPSVSINFGAREA